ncbi:MAG: response regulator [Cyclobacteriaceae bacterium]|nr:response regulator [Cyclobacteriaceae bacterium]
MTKTIRAILIDDEPLARRILKNYLAEIDKVEVVGEFENGFEGLKGINELKPDLVFLDIQMPKLNGFEMLELLDDLPHIVFTTAYDQFAVKAFENNAVDYLMKPFARDRLEAALDKARELICWPKAGNQTGELLHKLEHQVTTIDRIAVKTGNKIKIIYAEDIQYLESQDDYVMVYTAEGHFLKQKTMKFFESHLAPTSFIRVHRSYMVNIDSVSQVELYEKDSYIIKLKSGQTIPLSKTGYNRLRAALQF